MTCDCKKSPTHDIVAVTRKMELFKATCCVLFSSRLTLSMCSSSKRRLSLVKSGSNMSRVLRICEGIWKVHLICSSNIFLVI